MGMLRKFRAAPVSFLVAKQVRHRDGWPGGAKLLQALTFANGHKTTLEAGHGSTPLSPFSHGVHLGSCAAGPARFGSPGLPLGAKLPICNLLQRQDKVAWNIPLPDRIRGSFGEFMSKQDNKSLALQACGDHVRQRMPSSQPNGMAIRIRAHSDLQP